MNTWWKKKRKEFMEGNKMKNFTYDDLKAGMRVERRDGTIAVLMPVKDGFIMLNGYKGCWDELSRSQYYTDLTHQPGLFDDFKNMDIMKVYDIALVRGSIEALVNEHFLGNPIWTREKPAKEMTVEEISKALGYEVKIVK